MFGRLPYLVHVNTRCRSQTFCHNKHSLLFVSHDVNPPRRRWQTSVASDVHNEHDLVTRQQHLTDTSSGRNRTRAARSIRHWRPIQAAELGFEVLGKPAEVLLVPARGRRITKVPVSDPSDQVAGIQACLEAEARPVSKTDIKANIEGLRTELHTEDLTVSTERRDGVKQHLASGFTKKQLLDYLREESKVPIDAGLENNVSRTRTKLQIAELILDQAWNLTLKAKVSEQQEDKQEIQIESDITEQPPVVEEYVVTTTDVLDLLLRDKSQPLKEVSDIFDIQIHVFRAEASLRLEGQAEQVARGREFLNQFLTPLLNRTICLDDRTKQLLDDETIRATLAEELMQRYVVLIQWQHDNLQISARSEDQIDCVQRDVRLITLDQTEYVRRVSWPSDDANMATYLPTYLHETRSMIDESMRWSRAVSGTVVDKDTAVNRPTDDEHLAALITSVANGLGSCERVKLHDGWQIDDTYIVDLGRILVQQGEVNGVKVEQGSPRHPRTTFDAQIPLLPQLMNKLKVSEKQATQYSMSYRIQLHPLYNNKRLPSFEILMVRDDKNVKSNESLQMRKVSMIWHESTFGIQMPNLPVDLRAIRRSSIAMFDHDGNKPRDVSLPLLKTFASKFEWNNDHLSTSGPIWTLNLSDILLKTADHKGAELFHASQLAPSEHQDLANVEYIVEPPEALDICSTANPTELPGVYVHHTLADAGRTDVPHMRESLHLTEAITLRGKRYRAAKRKDGESLGETVKQDTNADAERLIGTLLRSAITLAVKIGQK